MLTAEPTPRTFYRLFETIDGDDLPCKTHPVLHKNPLSLLATLDALREQGRDVTIRAVSYTLAQGVAAIRRGASREFVQQLTGWTDEDMDLIAVITHLCREMQI